MNNNFYTPPVSAEETRQRLAMQQNGQQGLGQGQGQDIGMVNAANLGALDMPPLVSMEAMPLAAGESIDDIVDQNSREFQRRRSVPHLFADPLSEQAVDRRMSMMDFDDASHSLQGFSYGFPNNGTLPPGASVAFPQQGLMTMPGHTDFSTLPSSTLDMGDFSTMDSLFTSPGLQSQYPSTALDAVGTGFPMDMAVESGALNVPSVSPIAGFAVGESGAIMRAGETFGNTAAPQATANQIPNTGLSQFQPNMSRSNPLDVNLSAFVRSSASSAPRTMSQSSAGRSSIVAGTPASTAGTSAGGPLPAGLGSRDSKKDVYSKSGFDMLRALYYVATRKNPTVEIGAVDLSCAFVVCDVTLPDCPIVYVSDNFQNLTGYNRHEILGQNCRFLQSPDGKVEIGSRREFVANDAVFKLKNAVAEGREIQQSLINYRKGGMPFLNLLTMIPIPWDSDDIRYCIGFQIDIVECADAISGQGAGSMQINYRRSDMGQDFWTPPHTTQWEPESGQTLGVDEVSTLIQQYNPKAPPSEWHKQSWDKMLLENADDVIHVLSLKGLFLYVSPACKKTLEYDPKDLVGTSLSAICHPSDIVPVTRELKDAQPNSSVNIAFRIRRKHSGYMWLESHGTLFYEQTKGRKYIILVGRKRPVFALRRRDVEAYAGGIAVGGDSEIWSKISTSGMFLYVSSSAKSLLDLAPRDLEGTSMQELMKKESRAEFGRVVEKARKGAVAVFRHEFLHKRGQLIPAQTVFYPGDGGSAARGKPSFLIAQTRLVKGAGRVIAVGKSSANGPIKITGERGGWLAEDLMSGVVMGDNNAQLSAPLPMRATYPDSATEDEQEDDDVFAELKTTRCASWQYELRQMAKVNRLLGEELSQLQANRKKRKRRKGGGSASGAGGSGGNAVRDCANCHRQDTPEWRRGPSGNRDLCNSCGLRWAKQTGKVTPRNTSRANSDTSAASKRASVSTASTNSPVEASPLRREVSADAASVGSAGGMVESGSFGEGSGGGAMEMGPIREE